MYHAEKGFLAATNELLSLHIDLATRRVGQMGEVITGHLGQVLDAHAALPLPRGAGAGNAPEVIGGAEPFL